MADESITIWIPAIAGIVGALVGAVSTYIPAYFVEQAKRNRDSSVLKNSLVSEVSALIQIIEKRDYLGGLQDIISQLSQAGPGKIGYLSSIIPDHYSRIYQSTCNQIGIIDMVTASKIIRFHQLVDAVVQDIKPGGILAVGSGIDAFKEAHTTNVRGRRYWSYNSAWHITSHSTGLRYAHPVNSSVKLPWVFGS